VIPFNTLLKIDKQSRTPIYLQLTNQFIKEISSGRISAGMKLPGSRKLATSLELNRNTINAVYNELKAQGWLVTKDGSGTYVQTDSNLKLQSPDLLPSHTMKNTTPVSCLYHYDDGHPDVRLAPLLALTREMSALVKTDYFHENLNYTEDFQGDEKMRNELVVYLNNTRGINIHMDEILLTRGTIMSFHLLCNTLLEPFDNVLVGTPGYLTFNEVVNRAGGQLIEIPVDVNGICVDQIEEICKTEKIKLVYVVPHHHHPSTVRLSAERRMRLLELSNKYGFIIIEDDYDYDFHYDNKPILPLASYPQVQQIIYVGSFSKLLVPSIRQGFMLAPRALIEKMKISRRYIDRCGDPLVERSMAHLLNNGLIGRHLRKSMRSYRKRRDLLCGLIDRHVPEVISYDKPAGGMAIWAKFRDDVNLRQLIFDCEQDNLSISNPESYNHSDKQMTRLGFASMNEEEHQLAFDILQKNIKKQLE